MLTIRTHEERWLLMQSKAGGFHCLQLLMDCRTLSNSSCMLLLLELPTAGKKEDNRPSYLLHSIHSLQLQTNSAVLPMCSLSR